MKKNSIKFLIGLVVVISIFSLFHKLSEVIELSKSGADISAALNLADDDQVSLGNTFSFSAEESWDVSFWRDEGILDEYVHAYVFLATAISAKEPSVIPYSFIGSAAKKAAISLMDKSEQGFSIPLMGKVNLVFAPNESKVVEFKSNEVVANFMSEAVHLTQREVDVLSVYRQGRWRIAASRLSSESILDDPGLDAGDRKMPEKINGVNYYPADSAFDKFWQNYDRDQIEEDLDLVSTTTFNGIRIFINHDYFSSHWTEALNSLDHFLDASESRGLKVQVVLNDMITYERIKWPYYIAVSKGIVEKYNEHGALHSWDVKNEPDLDFEIYGKDFVLSFLRTTLAILRLDKVTKPVTIGWSSYKYVGKLGELLDFHSFHFFEGIDKFDSRVTNSIAAHDTDYLSVSEYGYTTGRGYTESKEDVERNQKEFIAGMNARLGNIGINVRFVWTLFDYSYIPDWFEVWYNPWRGRSQRSFGLFSAEGPKPAGRLYSN